MSDEASTGGDGHEGAAHVNVVARQLGVRRQDRADRTALGTEDRDRLCERAVGDAVDAELDRVVRRLLDLLSEVLVLVADHGIGPELLEQFEVVRRGRGDDLEAGQLGELDDKVAYGRRARVNVEPASRWRRGRAIRGRLCDAQTDVEQLDGREELRGQAS